MSETNTNQREPGSDRDPILEAENHQQAQRAPLSLKVRILRRLAWLGRLTRHQLWFFLIMMGACWGVIFESFRAHSWRRTVRYEFGVTLNSVIGGGLIATLFAGTLTGVAAVSQTIYWLGFAGLAKMTGSILVNVVVREIAPILVGILLLGRNGMLSVTELGLLTTGGQIRSFQAQGLDPFLLLVMPRTLAFTVGGFTLGILFSFAALLTGYIISRISGVITNPVWTFFYDVVTAMSGADYIIIPLKFIVVGFVVGVGGCLTGLTATNEDNLRTLLPRGFSRGMLIVMAVSVLFSLDF
ncbi:ABC transporter permease [Acetobacter orientalis]|uniref:ABC transporter n=1 Tax=Acetobacter orientalis TaxID=146474 RepID=A0A252C6U6_9PROT|nr:ABC transporter permease [Acetobacter orientalis]MDN6040540.1 ABC transporter permease [Acetobacter sp.]MCP1216013.1 ABC transporter permease [Acetobacter orientalis]MCP1217827.1 ABC transporter permease [Acetobacter orientalis]OUI83993.1 ABC transporter permease [Acetobacter orientalis]OUJ16935.1 ABC transporter permease [Acetobacter orientalis]